MKTTLLIRLAAASNLLFAAIPFQAVRAASAAAAAPADLLQFTAGGHALGFADGGMYAATGSHALHVDFAEANSVPPQADSPAGGQGQAAPLSRVMYPDLWDGITLTYTAGAESIYTTTYTLAPGADPAAIRLLYNAPVTLNEDGTLSIAFETGEMTESAPLAWQEIDGLRVPVAASFRVNGQEVSFHLGSYDPRYILTIDPGLTWHAFLGSSGNDIGYGIALDMYYNIYVTGHSESTWENPVRAYTGGPDAFVAKLNSSGALAWNTFLGGSGTDVGQGIAVDWGGNEVYVTGYSSVTWGSPVSAFHGGSDAFVAKLDPSTGALTWNTFLGGSGYEVGYGIAEHDIDNIYVAGAGDATWGSPVSAYTGGSDAFAAKLNSAGSLVWNTFLGGSGGDYGYGIAVDFEEKIVVAGDSNAAWGSPVRAYTGGDDAFAAKLESDGELAWNTFMGGSGYDDGRSIAVDGAGNIYMAGTSNSTWESPVRAYTNGSDAFAVRLNPSGGLMWNTFLGGSGADYGYGIAVDGGWNVYVSGASNVAWGSPVHAFSGSSDPFTAKLNSSGSLTWSTFLGGSGGDSSHGNTVDQSGNVYLVGTSTATWGSPVRAYSGGNDSFAAKIDSAGNPSWNTFLGVGWTDIGNGIAVDGSGNVYVTGNSESSWGNPVRAYSGNNDAFVAKLNSAGSLTWNTFLGGSGSEIGMGIAVDGSGNVYVTGWDSETWGSPVRAYSGNNDAFAAKLNSAGSLTWNTFLGGSGLDSGEDIAVDGSGNVYVTGDSSASWGSPVRAHTAYADAFAAELTSAGALTWNTFLGGTYLDYGSGIVVDGSGNVYVAGTSRDSWGSPLRAYAGNDDAFAVKLDSNGTLTWHTFLGGSGSDYGYAIAVDGSGNVYVTGDSTLDWGTPVRPFTDYADAFAAKLDSSGGLTWNTFLGGSLMDCGYDIAVDGAGNAYVTGYSVDTWGSPLRAFTVGYDAFAAKLDTAGGLILHTFLGGNGEDIGYSVAADGSGNVYVTGYSDATWGSPVRVFKGGLDAFAAKVDFSPPDAFSKTGPPSGSYVTTSPTLSWGASGDADFYIYCVDTIDNGICDTTWVNNGASTSASLSSLASDETYYWFVAATNAGGTTYADGGTWWNFTARFQTFSDVPVDYWAWFYIDRLFSSGITGGCGTSPLRFCPANSVTRAEMAIFLERGMWGSAYTPPGATGTVFADVPISYWAASWIEKLYADGITGGCGGGNYCPGQAVTRAEMAIFLLRAEHGSAYTPPAATGTVFTDIPVSYWAAAWIEQLNAEGITGGCGGGKYCPAQAVTRAEMAVFLVRTFNLP